MRRASLRKPKPTRSSDRDANRKLKYRRLLEMEVLESRLPVSEQIGTALGVSALSYLGGVAARLAVPVMQEPAERAKVITVESPPASGIEAIWRAASSEKAAQRLAAGSSEVRILPAQTQQATHARQSSLETDLAGSIFSDDLTQEFFDLLGSATAGRRGTIRGRSDSVDNGSGAGKADALLNQSSPGSGTAGGAASTMRATPSMSDTVGFVPETAVAANVPAGLGAAVAASQAVPGASSSGSDSNINTADQNGPGSGDKGKKKKDFYGVLDANYGIVVTPGVPDRQLSGAPVDLRQQVSGLSAISYSWTTDPNHPTDFTNVSGLTSYRLQFTWGSFNGAAHTDTVIAKYTDSSLIQHSLTLTFVVDAADSPASRQPPNLTYGTWPTVLTPDALASGQATVNSQYYSFGLASGALLINHGLPPYNPGVPPLALTYNSSAADRMPIFIVHYDIGATVPSTVSAQLKIKDSGGGTVFSGTTVTYTTGSGPTVLNPGDIMEIPLQGVMPSSQATGEYTYQMTVTGSSTSTLTGPFSFVNLYSSPFGDGWSLAGLEHITVAGNSDAVVDLGGGLSLLYTWNSTTGSYNSPQPNDFSTLDSGAITRTLPNGTVISFDSMGRESSLIAANGNTINYSYTTPSSNNLSYITDFDTKITTLTYNGSGKVSSFTDPAYVTSLGYNASGQLTSITDPAPGGGAATPVTTFGYASTTVDRITWLKDPDSNTTTFSYNSAGRMQSLQRPDLVNEYLTALQMQGMSTTTLAVEAQAQYTDGRSKVWKSRLDWLGYGLPSQGQDPLGNMAVAYHDSNGLPWLAADPLGDRSRTFFNSGGSPTQQADPTEYVLPDDKVLTFTYDGNSLDQPATVTDADGNTTTYSYCTCHCLTGITQPTVTDSTTGLPGTPIWTRGETNHGFPSSITNPLLKPMTFLYDSRDRATTITYASDAGGSPQTLLGYNSASEVTSVTDELTQVTTYAYDGFGRVVGVSLPTGGQISYTYDAASNISTVKDPDGNVTTYHYDALNRVSYVTDPGSLQNRTYTYDNTGNLQSVTDLDGRQRTFGYDNAGRLITETWVTTTTTFTYTYDAASRLIKAQDPYSVYSYTYDSRGRLLTVDNANSPGGFPRLVLSYSYDNVGNRLGLSDSQNGINFNGGVTYAYDADNRLTGAWMFASGSTSVPQITLGYDLDAQVRVMGRQITSGTGVAQITSSYDYTARNQVKSIQQTSSVAGILATYTYTYDDAQRLTTYIGPEGTVTFSYDSTNQLKTASGARSESYNYDSNGNRSNYNIVAGNRILFDGTYTYTYDYEGNVLTKVGNNGGVITLTWDFRNRLTRLQSTGGSLGPQDVTFTYDMFDRRIEKSTSSGQTWTIYDGVNPYADFSGITLQYRYLYGNAVDELFGRFDGTSGNNSTIWYLAEKLGSVRQMAKTDGSVVATITYDSFGNITAPVTGDRFKFAGREFDSETGLYYDRARYYDPNVGRFLSEDPLGFAAGDANLYRYVSNTPINYSDPSGEILPLLIIVGAGAVWLLSPSYANAPGPSDPLYGGTTFDSELYYSDEFQIGMLLAGGCRQPRRGGPGPSRPTGRGSPDPSTPVGRRGSPLGSVQGNAPTTIQGRPYSGHAIDKMQATGVTPSVVQIPLQRVFRVRDVAGGPFIPLAKQRLSSTPTARS